MSDLRYPRFGETGDLYEGQITHWAGTKRLLQYVSTREDPARVATWPHEDTDYAYQFWPQMTTPNMVVHNLGWSLVDQITNEARLRRHLLYDRNGYLVTVAPWGNRTFIDLPRALPWLVPMIATWVARYCGTDKPYTCLLCDGIWYRFPSWVRLTPERAHEWAAATFDLTRELASLGVPITIGGDAFAPPMEMGDGIKIEEALVREQSFADEIVTPYGWAPDTDNRGYVDAHRRCRLGSRYTLLALHEAWADADVWPREVRGREARLKLATAISMVFGDGILTFGSHSNEALHQAHMETIEPWNHRWRAVSGPRRNETTATGRIIGSRDFADDSGQVHTVSVDTQTWEVKGL